MALPKFNRFAHQAGEFKISPIAQAKARTFLHDGKVCQDALSQASNQNFLVKIFELVSELFAHNKHAVHYLPTAMEAAVLSNRANVEDLDDCCQTDELAFQLCKKDPLSLRFLPFKLILNQNFMMSFFTLNAKLFNYAYPLCRSILYTLKGPLRQIPAYFNI